MTTLLHTTVEGDRNTFREHATWSFLERNEKAMLALGWDIANVIVKKGEGHDYEYDAVIRHYWGKDDLLVFERDMVPNSFAELKALVDCPEPACAQDYPLIRCFIMDVESKDGESITSNRVTDKHGRIASNHLLVCVEHNARISMMRNAIDQGTDHQDATWNDGTWTHCDVPPLGLTKIRKEVMLRIPAAWPRTHWLDVDQMVGNTLSMNGQRTHIHLPMAKHMRRFKPNECAYVATLPREYPIVRLEDVKPEYQWKIKDVHQRTRKHTAFPKVLVQ